MVKAYHSCARVNFLHSSDYKKMFMSLVTLFSLRLVDEDINYICIDGNILASFGVINVLK